MSIIEVDCVDMLSNPRCPHGPMIKFTKLFKGSPHSFFGCSSCRDPKDCFTIGVNERLSDAKKRAIEEAKVRLTPCQTQSTAQSVLRKVMKLKPENRYFCKACFQFVFSSNLRKHGGHDVVGKLSDEMLRRPSNFITAKTKDKIEAQYWFDEPTKQFVLSLLTDLKVRSTLCIGTPTVHELLRSSEVKSWLLDIDPRYMTFYDNDEFHWFNMMNVHFFLSDNKFNSDASMLFSIGHACALIDPPFGARLELLAHTIRTLSSACKTSELFVFLALPYFMEPQVLKYLPNFKMLDYVLHYNNHAKMKSHKRSAVRFFTNVPPSQVCLPREEGYYFCQPCQCWRHPLNRHCNVCSTCPSKNGTTYKHCDFCNICVKSTWDHCEKCAKCFLVPHTCGSAVYRKRKEEKKSHKRLRMS